jgi:murein DD-endopeptidase MepM/ murein hydrolase activator NlpD
MAKRSAKLSVFITVILVLVLAGGCFLLFQDRDAPVITISHTVEEISPNLPITVTIIDATSPIKRVNVVARHQENEIPVVSQTFDDDSREQSLTFTLAGAGLKNDTAFDLEITAVDASFGGFGFGNKGKLIAPMRLDATPPRMSVKTSTPYVRRGGSSVIVYSIAKEVQQTGVKVNDYFFPAFRQENGDFLCFFAFPYYLEVNDFNPQLVALDRAGNLSVSNLPVNRINRQFKQDTINITQSFLNSQAAEFEAMVPGQMSDIDRFLIINRQIRRENALTLLEIGKDTAPHILWAGAFMRLPRAAPRAGFADHRDFIFEGQVIDQQLHLGLDLASVRQAPIPAANSGTVVYADYLGIYGNMVVIDHGLGLQSLYSHLSEIGVDVGQQIDRGDIIGRTGTTGMAAGDHLHFGILLSGLEVTPLEWLDSNWIRNNVVDRIQNAGFPLPEFKVEAVEPPAQGARRR